MNEEYSEVAVEINSILNHMSIDLLNRIPLKIREYYRDNASSTYTFVYDERKNLDEQNIKDKTRAIIALLYRDYICDEDERSEFNNKYYEFVNKKEIEKRKLYNPEDIFKKQNNTTNERSYNSEDKKYLEPAKEKNGLLKRIIDRILKFFK